MAAGHSTAVIPNTDLNTPSKKRRIDELNNSEIDENIAISSPMEESIERNRDSDSESDSDSVSGRDCHDQQGHDEHDTDSRLPLGTQSYRPNCNFIEKYTFPVLIEDTGKKEINQESLSDYEFDLNRLFTLAQVGRVRATRRVAPGKYVVDCHSHSQRQTLLPRKHLRTPAGGYVPIQCKIPQPVTEGVIGPISRSVPIESIKEKVDEYNLKYHNKKISKFARVTKYDKSQNATSETAFIRLTFECASLPESIYLGPTLYGVEVFRRDPILCSKCHLLGHTKNKCRKSISLCGKCLMEKHPCGEKECPVPKSDWYCKNCKKKGHSASWPRCPQKLIMRKALEIQAATYMPLAAAVSLVTGSGMNNQINPKTSTKLKNQNGPPKRDKNHFPNIVKSSAALFGGDVDSGPSSLANSGGGDGHVASADSVRDRPGSLSMAPSGSASLSSDNSLTAIIDAMNKNNEAMQKKIDTAVSSLQSETDKRFKRLSQQMDALQKQKEQQLKTISEFVTIKKQSANASERAVLDIIDVIRQAAEGHPESLFTLAKKVGRSSCDIGDELKNEISILTQNINF